MKNIFIALVHTVFIAIIFCGCENKNTNEQKEQNTDMFEYGIKTIEYEGCEYVVFKDRSRSSITVLHKKNCKFCVERGKNIKTPN